VLDQLDPMTRRALALRFMEEASYEDIARAVGKPSAAAARVSIRRALARVSARMHEVSRSPGSPA
jgi:DNA-directed RNA polymerase specialized sigma24 family protein